MNDNLERPKFLTSFFSAMAERSNDGTLWKMFVVPVIAFLIGGIIAYLIPRSFWADLEVASTVYTGILTLNGLILALSWSAFARIYESISAPKFCSFLRRHNLLEKYIATISFIHGLQLFAIIASATGLVILLINFDSIYVDKSFLAIMVFASIYSIEQAASAVSIMNDLLWQKSIFDENDEGNGDGKVVSLGGKDDQK